MQVLFEAWLSAGEEWDKSQLVISIRNQSSFKKRGSRRWFTRADLMVKYRDDEQAVNDIIAEKLLAPQGVVRCHPDAPKNKTLEQYLCFDEGTEAEEEDTILQSLFSATETSKNKSKKRKKGRSSSRSSEDTDSSRASSNSSSSRKKGKKGKKSKKRKGKKEMSKKGKAVKEKSKEQKEKERQKELQKVEKEKARDAEKKRQEIRSEAKKAGGPLHGTWSASGIDATLHR